MLRWPLIGSLWLVGWFGVLLPMGARAAAEPASSGGGLMSIQPPPSKGALVNPGKGWSASGMPDKQPAEVLELLSMGVQRFAWADLEPQEGQFDWTRVERFLEAWGRLGKVCNLGVMCANTHTRDPEGYVTPRWVFAAGVGKHTLQLEPKNSAQGTPGQKIAPVFDDPVFLAKFAQFLQAFAAKYDGDPRIAVLDIRSYGNWGECHMSPFKVPDIAPEQFRKHVEMHVDAFHKTQLCLSRNSHLGKFGPLKEVFDWAVLQKHIAPRRDGICGNSDGSETAIGLGIAPGVFELFGDYEFCKSRGWWDGQKDRNGCGFRLEECIENGKPTWVDLARGGKSGQQLLQENRELVQRLTNRIGYHFHLQRASFPRQISGGSAAAEFTWINQGVAPIYVPCAVAVALLNDMGQPVATCWPAACRPAKWTPGQQVAEKAALHWTGVPAGSYRLAVALTRARDDATPYIRLGSDLPDEHGWAVLGAVSCR